MTIEWAHGTPVRWDEVLDEGSAREHLSRWAALSPVDQLHPEQAFGPGANLVAAALAKLGGQETRDADAPDTAAPRS